MTVVATGLLVAGTSVVGADPAVDGEDSENQTNANRVREERERREQEEAKIRRQREEQKRRENEERQRNQELRANDPINNSNDNPPEQESTVFTRAREASGDRGSQAPSFGGRAPIDNQGTANPPRSR